MIMQEWFLPISKGLSSVVPQPVIVSNPTSWRPLLPDTIKKLNFDGAAKGNPNPTGYKGIIRENTCMPVFMYLGTIDINKNNAVELSCLRMGLEYTHNQGFQNISVEGGS